MTTSSPTAPMLAVDHCPRFRQTDHRLRARIIDGACTDCGHRVGGSRARHRVTNRAGRFAAQMDYQGRAA